MNDIDQNLAQLRSLPVPSAPAVEELRRRNRRRANRKVITVGLAVLVVVGVLELIGGRADNDSEGILVGEPDRDPKTTQGVELEPRDPSTLATPDEVRRLDELPACGLPVELFVGDLDPGGTIGVAGSQSRAAPMPASVVLDRVPVDVRAAQNAQCVDAYEIEDLGLVAIRVHSTDDEPTYLASSVPNGGPLAPPHSSERTGEYQQVSLGSGHPFLGYYVSVSDTEALPVQLLGVAENRRLSIRTSLPTKGPPASVLSSLVMTPPDPDSIAGSLGDEFRPDLLPAGAAVCQGNGAADPPFVRWCSPSGSIEVSVLPESERFGEPIDINDVEAMFELSLDPPMC